MVGGDEAAFAALEPLVDHGQDLRAPGLDAGAGQHTKMVNQILIASGMIGVCEALLYAHQRAGLDAERVLPSVASGAAGSWSLSNYGPRILAGNFEPGFFVEHFIKDMAIALDEAPPHEAVAAGRWRWRAALPVGAGARLRAQGHARARSSRSPPCRASTADGHMTHFRPPRWLRGRHAQTVWALGRSACPSASPLAHERWELPDGDFIDVDRYARAVAGRARGRGLPRPRGQLEGRLRARPARASCARAASAPSR